MPPKKRTIRRNKRGQFSRYGTFTIVNKKLTKIPRAAPRAPALRAPPRRPPDVAPPRPAAPTGRKGAKFTTWFRAMGTVGSLRDMRGAASPDLLGEDLEEYAAPAAFYSNQSGLFGRVRWQGIVALDVLIDRLNAVLQFTGESSRDFDFQMAYDQWEYRYQIVETIGPTSRVIEERRDSKPRRRRA